MKLKYIYRDIVENTNIQVEPSTDSTIDEESKVILLINKIENDPTIIQQLHSIKLLSSKYKALKEFGRILGIKPEEFNQVIQQAKIQSYTIPD